MEKKAKHKRIGNKNQYKFFLNVTPKTNKYIESKQSINAVTENFGFPSLETSPKSSSLATTPASTDSRKRNPKYYKEKNLYPDYLPVVPVSELVEDQNMINEIWSKIKLSENDEHLKFCNRVWSTQMRPRR